VAMKKKLYESAAKMMGNEIKGPRVYGMVWYGESRSLGIRGYNRGKWLEETRKNPNHDSQ